VLILGKVERFEEKERDLWRETEIAGRDLSGKEIVHVVLLCKNVLAISDKLGKYVTEYESGL